jgi:hypothetical protein
MKIKNIIISWDFITALIMTVIIAFVLPSRIKTEFASSLYETGISVLSIVFSVYFAALAIIISSSDDDFVKFLEKDGDYSAIVDSFKFSLALLFIALIYSILLFSISSFWISETCLIQSSLWLIVFIFLFLYSMFAALNSTLDSLKYAKFRTRFLNTNIK